MTLPLSRAVEPLACSVASAEAGEPLHGTAVAATSAWLLLDVRQPWGPRGFEDATLPPAVRQHLESAVRQVPGVRTQLIRPLADARGTNAYTLVVVMASHGQRLIHRYPFERLEDLLHIDVATLLQGRGAVETAEPGRRLALVCTHGRRDRCCARHGPPIARALADTGALELWQTTHLGGHRFAPTLVFLPEAVAYGRVQAVEVPDLVSAHVAGRIDHLERYRGRTFHVRAAQSADYFIRRHTGIVDLDGVRVRTAETVGDRAVVTFEVAARADHVVTLKEQSLPTSFAKSCGGEAEIVRYYALESIVAA